jgi:hypothetical protein
MPTHIILWYSTFTQIYTHWPDRNAVLASRQCLLHIIIELMIVFSINWILVKIDRCLRHAWARQNTYYRRHIKYYGFFCFCILFFYFHRQSDDNHITRTVKEIWSDFNWSINLVNILLYTCSLIKSVFVILFISFFPFSSKHYLIDFYYNLYMITGWHI